MYMHMYHFKVWEAAESRADRYISRVLYGKGRQEWKINVLTIMVKVVNNENMLNFMVKDINITSV